MGGWSRSDSTLVLLIFSKLAQITTQNHVTNYDDELNPIKRVSTQDPSG